MHTGYRVSVPTSEDLGDQRPSSLQHMSDDRQGCQYQLQLHVLIQVMQPCHIWGTITNDKICMVSFKLANDC